MMQIPLLATPNQSLDIVLDDNYWVISFTSCNGVITASFSLNGTDILDNIPCVAALPLIPYQYLESGNFFFVTQNQQIPDYTQFGVTQYLIYINATELATYRTAPTLPITASFFNPIAALPMRFAPTY